MDTDNGNDLREAADWILRLWALWELLRVILDSQI